MSANPLCYPLTQSLQWLIDLRNPKAACEASPLPLIAYSLALGAIFAFDSLFVEGASLHHTALGPLAALTSAKLLDESAVCGDEPLIPENQESDNFDHLEPGKREADGMTWDEIR